jgi:hypothetical protein
MNAEFYLKWLVLAAISVSQVGFLRTSIHGDIVVWIQKDETLLLQELRQICYLWAPDPQIMKLNQYQVLNYVFEFFGIVCHRIYVSLWHEMVWTVIRRQAETSSI